MKEPAQSLLALMEVVETLRGPGGCPWDQEQTLEDVGRHLLEEACETVDAIVDGEGRADAHVCEELGDVLLNVFMASVIASESGSFGLKEVAAGIKEKLVRRHPHVFGDESASNSEEVLKLWNSIKASERQDESDGRDSRLDGVPRSMPTIPRAQKIGKLASRSGLDWPDANGVLVKIREELEELEQALSGEESSPGEKDPLVEEELGDILFTAVNLCRKLGYCADAALEKSTSKFISRFKKIEDSLGNLEECNEKELDEAWQRAKGIE